MKQCTKEEVRKYIKFEKAFGKSPFAAYDEEPKTKLYKRYKRIFN